MSECQKCPENSVSTEGADSCTICKPGLEANSQKTQCGKYLLVIQTNKKNHTSIICFKLAEITNGNELENSKYGQKTGKK